MNAIIQSFRIVSWVFIIAYLISIPFSIFFVIAQRKMGMKIEGAPNQFMGILFQFLTVWLITPVFLVKYYILREYDK